MARRRVKATECIGKTANLQVRALGPTARLCTLTMDTHNGASGVLRLPAGSSEPILTLDGERIVDARGRESLVTAAGMAPSVSKYILRAYLPTVHAMAGAKLQVR